MLFPQLAPAYFDEKHRDILSRMEAFYAEAVTINQSFWGEADTDLRFFLNDQTLWNDLYGNLPANRRRQFSFNRIKRVISMISGHQRRNRKSTIVTGYENFDSETADQFTKIFAWLAQREGIYETISDGFESSLITGMCLLAPYMDYREDPISGNIKLEKLDYNDFLIDPYFRKQDLSDCNGLWRRKYITKREALSLFPDRETEIMGLYGHDNRDGKFQYQPESYNYGLKNLLVYDEYWYRDYRTQKMIVDKRTGDTMEWRSTTKDSEERLKQFLQQEPDTTVIDQEIPTTHVAIVIQGRVFYDGPNPMGIDTFPFVPIFSYYHPESPYFPYRIQGVVRSLRDAQYLYNRRRIIELDILESQITSGFKYKENALVNPKDIFLQGQGRGLALKEEAQMTDVEQIVPPSVPPSMIQLSELLGKEIQEISGVNEELLGSAIDDKAGILSMLRQGAGLTTLQGLFDNLDHAQKLLGKVMLELIQANFTPGKIQKILEGKKPSDQFYNKAFGKYHATVEEGLNTTTQKQMQFAQLLQLREVGVPIPDEQLLEAATIQNKKELVDAITRQQTAAQQMAQQQQQIQMQQIMAQTESMQAQAAANRGLGIERASRVQENQALAVERRAAAIKDQDQAFLNLVKALKEIDSIDLSHIEKLMQLSQMMNQRQEEIQEKNSGPFPVVQKPNNSLDEQQGLSQEQA